MNGTLAEKIEQVFDKTLTVSARGGNDVFQLFESKEAVQVGTTTITSVDLRIKRAGSHPGFLVIEVGGQRVTLPEVRKHYPAVKITDLPRGRSMDEVTSHSVSQAWGLLSFSFKVSNPTCVSHIVFDQESAAG